MGQTVKQIHTAFDAVLDILSLQEERAASLGLPPQDAGSFKAYLERAAIDLMSLSASLLATKQKGTHSIDASACTKSKALLRPPLAGCESTCRSEHVLLAEDQPPSWPGYC